MEGEPIEEDEKIVSLPLTQVWTQDKHALFNGL